MDILFYIIATSVLIGSLLVILSRNPVHSVLSLILVFCLSSVLLLLLDVDFLALLFVVVYVGAIAVLFLFVIMMLNVKIVQVSESSIRWVPAGIFVTLALSTEIYILLRANFPVGSVESTNDVLDWTALLFGADLLTLLGSVLYSYFFVQFFLAALILLVALVGAITLTIGHKRGTRKQLVYKQVGRDLFGAIKYFK